MAANLLHLLLSSNNDWVVPASHDERRYLMLDVTATHKGNFAYFAALDAQMENGGLAAMLHELATMDLGDFHPRKVPDTLELGEQKLHSLDSDHRLVDGRAVTRLRLALPIRPQGFPALG